jgi:hypothetical protein
MEMEFDPIHVMSYKLGGLTWINRINIILNFFILKWCYFKFFKKNIKLSFNKILIKLQGIMLMQLGLIIMIKGEIIILLSIY